MSLCEYTFGIIHVSLVIMCSGFCECQSKLRGKKVEQNEIELIPAASVISAPARFTLGGDLHAPSMPCAHHRPEPEAPRIMEEVLGQCKVQRGYQLQAHLNPATSQHLQRETKKMGQGSVPLGQSFVSNPSNLCCAFRPS